MGVILLHFFFNMFIKFRLSLVTANDIITLYQQYYFNLIRTLQAKEFICDLGKMM